MLMSSTVVTAISCKNVLKSPSDLLKIREQTSDLREQLDVLVACPVSLCTYTRVRTANRDMTWARDEM